MLSAEEAPKMTSCQHHPQKKAVAKGLCAACYMRQRRAKSVTYVGRAPTGYNYRLALDCAGEWIERFDAMIDQSGDCHVWTGAKTRGGHGVFFVAGRTLLAHRLQHALSGGNPAAEVVMPTCGNPHCVNADHLEDGAREGGTADTRAKGRQGIVPKVGAHLRDRHTHPKARRIATPEGEFASASLAAEHIGILPRTAQRRATDCRDGWRWLD